MKDTITICLPLYKEYTNLSENEILSLHQLRKILNSHSIIAVAPDHLNLSGYSLFFQGSDFKIERFDDSFFESTKTYNKLCLTIDFYKRIRAYKFVLIYQTDAFVFTDEVNYWIDKSYDFIGAPWLKKMSDNDESDKVGNGGFSMRNIESCIRLLEKVDKYYKVNSLMKRLLIFSFYKKVNNMLGLLNPSLIEDIKENRFKEDVFFGILSKRIDNKFKVADFSSALRFSFEDNPETAYALNNEQLPFGCHAWDQNNPVFWKAFIK